jgi:hypothetical protein
MSPYCDNEADVAPHGSGLSKQQQRIALQALDPQKVAEVILGRMRSGGFGSRDTTEVAG